MKSLVRLSLAPSSLLLLAASFLTSESLAGESTLPAASVALEASDCASPCVMVFAKVGESFDYEVKPGAEAVDSECSIGVNAAGEASSLPAGLKFDPIEGRLYGVPLHPGFHEFVVLRDAGDWQVEQVVLTLLALP